MVNYSPFNVVVQIISSIEAYEQALTLGPTINKEVTNLKEKIQWSIQVSKL
jgi:hypothetical protein